MKIFRFTVLIILAAVFLSACVSRPAQPGETPSATTPPSEMPFVSPSPTGKPIAPPPVESHLEPEAGAAARQVLAERLGVPAEAITIRFAEQTEWPDACLGLPAEAEACAEVLTPGFRLELSAYGKTYLVRTDLAGDQVRLEDTVLETASSEAAVKAAIRRVVEELGVDPKEVSVLSVQYVEWQDTCLGLGRPDVLCAPALTPGYQVTLNAGGQAYEVRTDATAGLVEIAPQDARLR